MQKPRLAKRPHSDCRPSLMAARERLTFGIDGTGKRRLALIRINGEDVGDILIREGPARRWPDELEFWCAA